MKNTKIICLSLLFYCSSALGDIGFANVTFKDTEQKRELKTYIWYPSANSSKQIFAENSLFNGFIAAENSQISKKALPLYILVHGTSGNWRNMSWLAAKLANNAIIIAANHPDYTSGQASPDSVIRIWKQPKDVSFLIDSIFKSKYADFIDKNKIAVIGYSLGGYSALALSGAIVDLEKYIVFYKLNNDKSCQYFKKSLSLLNESDFQSVKNNLSDKRIKASIAIAPGFIESMTRNSVKNIKIPTLIISAEKDLNVPPGTHIAPFLKYFSKNIQRYEVSGASHFSFMQICKPGAIKILTKEGAEFVCKDGGSKARNAIHSEVFEKIQDFLTESGVLRKILPGTPVSSKFLPPK